MYESWFIIFICNVEKELKVVILQVFGCEIKVYLEGRLELDFVFYLLGVFGRFVVESFCFGVGLLFWEKFFVEIFFFFSLVVLRFIKY